MGIGLHTLRYLGRDDLGGGAVALQFRPARPLTYAAGQHGLWHIPGGGFAPFTLASAPEEEQITLATSLHSGSRMKRALGSLTAGARVRMAGPLSHFTLESTGDPDGYVVMLAQGIAITPFRAMLTHAALTHTPLAATVIHVAARHDQDGRHSHAYRASTTATAKEAFYPHGREQFTAELDAVITQQPAATYLIAGTRTFVTATTQTLTDRGIRRDRIRRDTF